MQYGYFDDEKREYVITRPDTPAPWANYLGSPEYGAIISNNAGGYSFARSGANGRILRYVFNGFDQPGRYIYLRDNDSGDYWSASWQPVGKDLAAYRSRCCHGTGYTRMEADYSGIHTEALYYVPLGKSHEVWDLRVTNNSGSARSLNITGYAEFTNSIPCFLQELPLKGIESVRRYTAIWMVWKRGRRLTISLPLTVSSRWPGKSQPPIAVTGRSSSDVITDTEIRQES